MMNKIIYVICQIFMFFIYNIMCRYNSCYFPESLFKRHIIIKNEVLRVLLIGEAVGRDTIVAWCDSNKLTIFGLMTYITLGTANLLRLILEIMMTFSCSWITDLDKVYRKVDDIFWYLMFFYFVIFFINFCIILHRRSVKEKKRNRLR